jgi:presequence protease
MTSSFELIAERHVPEINSQVKVYRHRAIGARLLSICNDDENKVFGITFRTPPASSNGIAHIMEHSVLSGSRKYPVKEPYIELAKGSLNTFLNAFTYPDKTCYPIASQNLQDFYNLIDVYLDAVFYPRISEHTLQQEGWHYEADETGSTLAFKGVVFNEMKGVYSSPDEILVERSRRSLFPDNAYGLDAGGDPAVIPNLTYAEFKAFHETYYHPSNAYIYFYGDDPEPDRLRLLDEWLIAFQRNEVQSQIPLQARFSQPQRLTVPYDSGDSPTAKGYVTVNWMLPEGIDVERTLSLEILSHILIATPASPLRKALIDSGLGEEVVGGVEDQLRQTYFSAGLKGVQPANIAKVEAVILDTLAGLAIDGFDPNTVAASLNTIEFRLREQNTGRFPRGLALMLTALSTWLYEGDPIAMLAFEQPLTAIKAKTSAGHYFESLLKEHLLDNLHRTTVSLLPDPEEGHRRAAAEQDRLQRTKATWSAAELQRVIDDCAELKRRQNTPDSPEALATIPVLKLSDLDRGIKTIPIEPLHFDGTPILFHDLFTDGIVYLDLGFDLHALPQDLLPYAGLFGRLLTRMGTEREDFVPLTQRIGRETGGILATTLTSSVIDSDRAVTYLFVRGKAMAAQSAALLNLLRDTLLTVRLDNRERFKQIVLEEKAGLEAGLIPGGSGVVNQRLRARFTIDAWAAEEMSGVSQLFFLRTLFETIEHDWDAVLSKLEAVRQHLVNRSIALTNVTLEAANWATFRPQLESFLATLPATPIVPTAWQPQHVSRFEGLTIPAQVNYVGKGAPLYRLGYRLHGSSLVISNYLNTTWLWEKVRMQGGAYGGFSQFDRRSGVFTYLSYRDPNLLATLDNFDATATFLRDLDLSEAELSKAIIGTIGDLDTYLLPDAKGFTSLTRYLTGDTDESRQQFRDEVLSTTAQDFKAFAEVLAAVKEHSEVVVLGAQDAITKANAERSERADWLEVTKVL